MADRQAAGITLALLAPLAAVAFVGHVGNRPRRRASRPRRRETRRAAPSTEASDPLGALVRGGVAAAGEAELELGDATAARRSLARALDRNPDSWSAWFDLAVASSGRERELALDRATALNPRSPEVDQLRTNP